MTAACALGRGLSLREAGDEDQPFLRHVYESSRLEELAGVSWGGGTRQAFLDQQFRAQAVDYRRRFPDARFLVVELEGAPIGRLYLADVGDTTHLLDIALLPEHRGTGFGEALLQWVIASGRRIVLTVGRWNRAQRLYLRLRFTVVAEDDTNLYMAREPLS